MPRGPLGAAVTHTEPGILLRSYRSSHSGDETCMTAGSSSQSGVSDGAATGSTEGYLAQRKPVYATVHAVTGEGGSDDSAFESGLPEFTRPPLVEVAVGLMFEPLPLNAVMFAQLYSEWRDDYPRFEEHPAIPSSMSLPGLVFDVGVPHLRLWFLGNSGRLIQVQRDRLIVNWRKEAETAAYPRYGSLRVELKRRLSEFTEFLANQHQSELNPNSVEVTYVNQVPLAGASSSLSDIVSILHATPERLGSPIETNLSVRFDVSAQLERESAALVVNAQRSPTVDPPLAVLQLSCSMPVKDLSDAFDALDKARYHVVQSFHSVTTRKMHEEWGLER